MNADQEELLNLLNQSGITCESISDLEHLTLLDIKESLVHIILSVTQLRLAAELTSMASNKEQRMQAMSRLNAAMLFSERNKTRH